MCRFCHHNYRHADERSGRYCPLDLYSGDICSVRRAIDGLCADPRNNLKAFRDGINVSPQDAPARVWERLCWILCHDPLLPLLNETMKDLLLRGLKAGVATDDGGHLGNLLKSIALLRDCSIIIRFCGGDDGGSTAESGWIGGYSMHMIDVDPKPDAKLSYYLAEFDELRRLYHRHVAWT